MPVPYPSGRNLWPSTHASIPANWSRDTNFDGRFLLGDGDSYTGPANAGSADHTHVADIHVHGMGAHEHEFSAAAATDFSSANMATGTIPRPIRDHDHLSVFSEFDTPANTETDGTVVTFPVQSNDWRAVEMIVIKPDDASQDIPDDAFCWTDETDLPTGFTKITEPLWEGEEIKAPTTGADGGSRVGQGNNHDHIATHVHGQTETHAHASKRSGGVTVPKSMLTGPQRTRVPAHHMVTGAASTGGEIFSNPGFTGGVTALPPFHELLGLFNTSGAAKTSAGVIIPYVGTPASVDAAWAYCDGNNGTPDLRDVFLKMSQNDGDIGDTGGSETHQHPGTETHGHPNATHTHVADPVTRDQEGGARLLGGSVNILTYPAGTDVHVHVWTFTDETAGTSLVGITSAASNHMPLSRSVIFIKKRVDQPAIFMGCNF